MTEYLPVTSDVDTRAFWVDVAERTAKTVLQTFALFLLAGVSIVELLIE